MANLHTFLGAGIAALVLVSAFTPLTVAAEDEPTPTPTPVLTLGRITEPAAGQTPLPTPMASSGIVITDSNIASYAARGKINVSGGIATREGAARMTPTPGPIQVFPGLEDEAAAVERGEELLAKMRQRHIEQPNAERQRAIAAAEKRLAILRKAYEDKKRKLGPTPAPTPVASSEDRSARQLEEVESLRQRVASLEERLTELRRAGEGLDAEGAARHQSQINATEQTLSKLRNQLDRAEQRLADFREEEEQTPAE